MHPLAILTLLVLPLLSHAQLPTLRLPIDIINDAPLHPIILDRSTAETAIAAKAAALGPLIGRAKGSLTFVSAPSTPAAGGFFQEFDSGTIYTERTSTTAWAVNGAILARYLALGGPKSPLGFPTSDWTGCPDGRGWFNTFAGGGGAIYWTPQTGANEVYGNPMAQWTALGRERGWLGYPLTGVQRGAEGSEMEAVVAFEGGVVTFNTRRDGRNGTVAWQDLFWGEYRRVGGPTGVLGLPVDRGMRGWFVQVSEGRGFMRMDFRGGYVRVPLDWPKAQGVQTTRVRVKFAGLECVARQETEDEMSGAIGLLVPAMKMASWVFKISDWRFKDHIRVWPVTAGNILYKGPPAEIRVFSELVEVDNSKEEDVANTCVNGLAGAEGLAGALAWIGEGQGENEVLRAYNREEAMWNVRWSVASSIQKDWFPGDNPYPEGRMMVDKLPDFQKSKQRVFRSDDSRIITYTHFIRMEGVDDGGDHGIYHVYFDLDYFPMSVML